MLAVRSEGYIQRHLQVDNGQEKIDDDHITEICTYQVAFDSRIIEEQHRKTLGRIKEKIRIN